MTDKRRSHGEGGVTARGPNKWRIRYDGATKTDGRRAQVSETIKGTKADALRALRERISSIETGTFVRPSKVTVDQYLAQWMERHSKQIAAKTASGYQFLFRRYITPVIGNLPLQKLEPQHVRAVLDGILDQGLSNKTASLAHSALRRGLADAVDDAILVVNPAGRVRSPRVQRKAPTVWDAPEIDRFLKAAASNRFVAYFELAILTGLRRSEIAGLRWANVDLDSKTSKTLRVVETLQRVDGRGLVTGAPKSDRSRRVIALSLRAVSLFLSVRAKQSEQRLKAGTAWNESGDYVFTDAAGKPLDSGRVSKEFRRVADSIGARRVTLHSLRHAHASLLISKGTHIKVVSERLGHASTSFTLDTYAHLLPGMQEAAAEAIDAALTI